MPSLRRFPSSAAGRRSPYSSASVRARRCRRSAPSETSGRQVLADITWWTVTEGQCDSNVVDISDAPFAENNIDDASPIDASVHQPPSLVLPWLSTSSEDVPEAMPIAQFAALAIAPGKPCKRDSSVDSSSGFSDSSFEAVLSPLDMGFFDSPLSPLPPCTLAPALARSLSFVDTYSLRVKKPSHYADFAISPLSSALDFLN